MRRRLFKLAGAAVSLLLCIATLALWVRNYGGSDYLARSKMHAVGATSLDNRVYSAVWTQGMVDLIAGEQHYEFGDVKRPDAEAPASWNWHRFGRDQVDWERPAVSSAWNRLGFFRFHSSSSFAMFYENSEVIIVPAWLPVVLLGAWPSWCVAGMVRRHVTARRRRRRHLCTACGYDLRATPQEGGALLDGCPECGAAPAEAAGEKVAAARAASS